MLSKTCRPRLVVSMAVTAMLLCMGGISHADGIVQTATKNAAKGVIKGVQQELNSPALVEGVKKATKGVIDGVAAAAPLVTSQIANQANKNRKAIGHVARQVSADAASGMMSVTMREMKQAFGAKGDGPMADALVATSARLTTATMRAMVAELRPDPASIEKTTAASVRGARSELHFNFSVWPLVLALALGGVSTLLCGVGLMLLYVLFQRRRAVVAEPAATRLPGGQPVLATS